MTLDLTLHIEVSTTEPFLKSWAQDFFSVDTQSDLQRKEVKFKPRALHPRVRPRVSHPRFSHQRVRPRGLVLPVMLQLSRVSFHRVAGADPAEAAQREVVVKDKHFCRVMEALDVLARLRVVCRPEKNTRGYIVKTRVRPRGM